MRKWKNEAAKQTICCFNSCFNMVSVPFQVFDKATHCFSWTFSGRTKRKATINYPYNTFCCSTLFALVWRRCCESSLRSSLIVYHNWGNFLSSFSFCSAVPLCFSKYIVSSQQSLLIISQSHTLKCKFTALNNYLFLPLVHFPSLHQRGSWCEQRDKKSNNKQLRLSSSSNYW